MKLVEGLTLSLTSRASSLAPIRRHVLTVQVPAAQLPDCTNRDGGRAPSTFETIFLP
jgi:hypothetical protein